MPRGLVVIDIQNDYFPGGAFPLSGPEDAARVASLILEAFRDSSEPVFHIQHVSKEAGAPFMVPGTPGVEINDAVAPEAGEPVIQKHEPNAFLNTDLEAQLRGKGVTEIVVVGMMTSMCVDATVRAASDLGFDVIVAHDATAAPDLSFDGVDVPAAQVQAAFLAALESYARVVPRHELI